MLLSSPQASQRLHVQAPEPVSLEPLNVSALPDFLRRLPLSVRIALPVLLCSLLTSALLYPLYLDIAHSRSELAMERRSAALADLLAITLAQPIVDADSKQVQRILSSLARDTQLASVAVVDLQGRIQASYPAAASIELPATGGAAVGGLRSHGSYSSWRPLLVDGSDMGRLYLTLKVPMERIHAMLALMLTANAVACGLLVALVLSIAGRRGLKLPLQAFSQASRDIAEGDFDVQLPEAVSREVGELRDGFAVMIESLRGTVGAEQEAAAILAVLQEALLMVDESGRITDSNPAAQELLSYSEEDLKGMDAQQVIDLSRMGGSQHDSFIENAATADGECTFLSSDGRRIPVIFSAARLATESGERLVLAAHDLSQRVRQEDYLREATARAEHANRAKSQFLAKMSHELRTPLNAILGFAQIQKARLEPDSPDYLFKNTEHTLSAGWHLLNLINDVLDISRIEENNLPLSVEECKLSEVVAHSRSLVLTEAKEAGVSIELEDSPLLVLADYTRLKQVFVNLFNNAIKYNRRGGSISFRARELEDGRVECRVKDTGVGMSTEEVESIFEPFTRLAYAEQNEIQGTGIGLALTRRLVELMGGTIRVSSEPGEGSTFHVELQPGANQLGGAALSEQTESIDTDMMVAAGRKPMTIFYVEDNPASLELMKAIMDPLPGVTLLTATSAEEGIELAYRHQPDLMILDINLPGGMDGVAAARAIRSSETLRHIPLVALSADATEDSIDTALAGGFDDYLTKPLDIDKLMHLVAGLSERKERTQA